MSIEFNVERENRERSEPAPKKGSALFMMGFFMFISSILILAVAIALFQIKKEKEEKVAEKKEDPIAENEWNRPEGVAQQERNEPPMIIPKEIEPPKIPDEKMANDQPRPQISMDGLDAGSGVPIFPNGQNPLRPRSINKTGMVEPQ